MQEPRISNDCPDSAAAWLIPTSLLEPAPDEALDRLVRLAARVLGAPAAVVALRSGGQLFLKSSVGLPEPFQALRTVPLDVAPCAEVLRTGEPLIHSDIQQSHPSPPGSPSADLGTRGYAAAPLIREGETFGVFAVMDTAARCWSEPEVQTLLDLSASVLTEIEWRIHAAERARAEEVLRRNEKRFRALVEHSADVIDVLEPDGTIRYTTSSVLRVLGFEPAELVGTNVFDYIHPDDRARAISGFQRGLDEFDGSRVVEVRVRHRDGSWRWFEAAARNLLAEEAVAGLVITSRDATARKEAAAELQRGAAILAAIPDAVVVTDLDGVVSYWNDGATSLFGRSGEEMLGAPLETRSIS